MDAEKNPKRGRGRCQVLVAKLKYLAAWHELGGEYLSPEPPLPARPVKRGPGRPKGSKTLKRDPDRASIQPGFVETRGRKLGSGNGTFDDMGRLRDHLERERKAAAAADPLEGFEI